MKTNKSQDIIKYADIFKALSHPIRLSIAYNLLQKEECNVNKMCECLKISQPTISQHLLILKNANIITGCRKGTQICYKICNKQIADIISSIL